MTALPTSSKTLLLLGATGETGRQALLSALSSPSISSVLSLGRRSPSLPADTPGYSKLQHISLDFSKLLDDKDAGEQAKLRDAKADLVVCALGTTRAAAGGMDKFVRIDREFVLEAVRQAKVEGKEQTVVYCSVSCVSLVFPESLQDKRASG
jgi:oxidoreductase